MQMQIPLDFHIFYFPSRPPTLSSLGFWDSFPDDPAGVVHRRARLKLHGLHHIALADADL